MAVTFLEDCFTRLLPECLLGPLMLVLTAQMSHIQSPGKSFTVANLRLCDPVPSQPRTRGRRHLSQPNDKRFCCQSVLKQNVRTLPALCHSTELWTLDLGCEGGVGNSKLALCSLCIQHLEEYNPMDSRGRLRHNMETQLWSRQITQCLLASSTRGKAVPTLATQHLLAMTPEGVGMTPVPFP